LFFFASISTLRLAVLFFFASISLFFFASIEIHNEGLDLSALGNLGVHQAAVDLLRS
jgi:hypothetical protein